MAETGHIKNIENFEVMISACNGFGWAYNPNNSALAISALQTALNDANAGSDGVTTGLIPWKVKVKVRENEYVGAGKLSTRIASGLGACGATKNRKKDRDGRPEHARRRPPDALEVESKHNSVSQRSYTQIAQSRRAIAQSTSSNI